MLDDTDSLFAAFDGEVPAARPSSGAAEASATSAPAPARDASLALPSPWHRQSSEALVSVAYRRISPEDRAQLEALLRRMAVPDAPSDAPDGADAPPVHYFQSYAVDYAGETSAAAAAALPRPQYERLYARPGGAGQPAGQERDARRRRQRPSFQGRYFDAAPEETQFTPGVLSPELRAMLGIGPSDPPQYLSRMQNLGYPPGYLGRPGAAPADDDASPLDFHADEAAGAGAVGAPPAKRGRGAGPDDHLVPLADIPGLNVPPPAGSDPARWNWQGPITSPAAWWRQGEGR